MLFPKPAPEIMMSIMAVNMKVKLMLIMRVPRVKKAKMPVLLLPQSSTTLENVKCELKEEEKMFGPGRLKVRESGN